MTTAALSPRIKGAGAAWLAAGSIFLLTEAVAASRFSPGYSYARNFISELGVPGCITTPDGVQACSPLATGMNTAFLLAGVLFITALAFAAPLKSGGWRRIAFVALGLAHGVGMILVASFHGGGGALKDGTIAWHVLGATLAIVCGNLAIAISPAPVSAAAPAGLRRFGLIAGGVGLVGLVLLVASSAAHQPALLGLWERISCYSIISWEIAFGGWLLLSRR